MTDNLTFAEQKALEATKLESFPVQLHEVRRTVSHILSLFGRNNFFPEYTVHSYDHVHAMLEDLNWIIPNSAKEAMTSADWLMITLATYFHDLGLIVTEQEFEQRASSGFKDFCEKILFGRDDGADYKQKIDALGPDRAERFYYSEFVRYNHAARVRNWIQGVPSTELGKSDASAKELGLLLGRLSQDFKHDLGNICESHNLDDLQDVRKYKTFQPYGRSDEEACNLLYVAVLLRTSDLLQITKQRAPSVLHRFISPTDPLSQVEWAKQNSVRGVFPKPVLDKEGVKTNEQPYTISVYAKFDNENGFFGLTSYLRYAQSELHRSYNIVSKAIPALTRKYYFPWREIDDSQVEADGFIPHPFEFKIDQAKILDLLTGHTLYNDSSVAVRELLQNAIDAVRLQFHMRGEDSSQFGRIEVRWDSEAAELSITDNGTGMTQEVIERHLLSVGSSRYQEPKFKEKYPDFSPISRFGIGVLSAFMVADNVKIITIHPEEEFGRQISLRSVHGKYLIRLLNKETDPSALSIGSHGTTVIVRMRPSSKRFNVASTIDRWIVFPRCNITLQVDDGEASKIGYENPRQSIDNYLASAPEMRGAKDTSIVHQLNADGLTVAFATRYNRHFRDRSFIQLSDDSRRNPRVIPPVGLCVEGIRVQFAPPGFVSGSGVLAIADCVGSKAPRTNVSRSALEEGGDRNHIQEKIFTLYFEQVGSEIQRLQEEEGFSLAYAVEQFPFIASALLHPSSDDNVKRDVLRKFPLFIVESKTRREQISAAALADRGEFWTIDSHSLSALMALLRDTKSDVTSRQVSEFCSFKGAALPKGSMLTNASSSVIARSVLESEFEICELHASETDRRLDARWRPSSTSKIWISGDEIQRTLSSSVKLDLERFQRSRQRRRTQISSNILVAVSDINLIGLSSYFAVARGPKIYVLPGTPLCNFLASLAVSGDVDDVFAFLTFCDALLPPNDFRSYSNTPSIRESENYLRDLLSRSMGEMKVDIDGFLASMEATLGRLSIFNPMSWKRSEGNNETYDYDYY